jgi:GntR family transcriptional regulator
MGNGFNDRFAAPCWIARFEDARADEDTVNSKLHHKSCVSRCGDAAGGKVNDRQPAKFTSIFNQFVGCTDGLGICHQLLDGHILQLADRTQHRASMAHGLNNVPSPGFAFCADHGCAFTDAPQSFTQVAAAADEGHLEQVFVDVVFFIGRCKHFRFVDVIHAERLEDLSLDEMADAAFCHDWNRDGIHNFFDEGRVAHAGYATMGTDISWHSFERHDRHCSGLLGDARVLGCDDIHDDAALEHLCEPLFYLERTDFFGHDSLQLFCGLALSILPRSPICRSPHGDGIGRVERNCWLTGENNAYTISTIIQRYNLDNWYIYMFSELDFRSHIPIYVQIVDRVEHLIATGVLEPGDQLPTVRQLAAELRVNFNTVARAYRILDENGVISTQQGRGTYVLEAPLPDQASNLRAEAIDSLTRTYLDEASRMGFDIGDVQDHVLRLLEEWQNTGEVPSPDQY